MNINEHLNKDNLHHAYLIEGGREEIVPEVLKFLEDLGVQTVGNSDFMEIALDTFRIEDARNLRTFGGEKSFTAGRKVFIVSANNFLLEAQNSLLKMFEEPIENTHFFLIVPDANSLLPTLVSRFYFISPCSDQGEEMKEAEKFIRLSLRDRIDYLKELLVEPEGEDEDGNEIITLDSTRSKALRFLNAIEGALHVRFVKTRFASTACFEQIFKVREFLRMPGSSVKSLMESVALVVPDFSK